MTSSQAGPQCFSLADDDDESPAQSAARSSTSSAVGGPHAYSLDFEDGLAAKNSQGPAMDDSEALSAALELFDICKPDRGAIQKAALQKVLEEHLGHQGDISETLNLLDTDENINFLIYWQGMENWFVDTGMTGVPDAIEKEDSDPITVMRAFRNKVLIDEKSKPGKYSVPTTQLVSLLQKLQLDSNDLECWDPLMQGLCAGEENAAVPLKDVAEAVRNWLVLRIQQQAAFEDDSSVSDAELNDNCLSELPPSRTTAIKSPCSSAELPSVRRNGKPMADRRVKSVSPTNSGKLAKVSAKSRFQAAARLHAHAATDAVLAVTRMQHEVKVTQFERRRAHSFAVAKRSCELQRDVAAQIVQHIKELPFDAPSQMRMAVDLAEACGHLQPNDVDLQRAKSHLLETIEGLKRNFMVQEDQVSALQRTVKQLRPRNNELEEEVEALHEQLHERCDVVDLLQAEREETKKQRELIEEEVEELRALTRSQRQELAEVKEQLEVAQMHRPVQTESTRALETRVSELQTKIHKLTWELDKQKSRTGKVASASRSYAAYAQENEEIISVLEERHKLLLKSPTLQAVSMRAAESSDSTTSQKAHQAQVSSLQSQLEDKNAKVAQLEAKYKQISEQAESDDQEVKRLQKRVQALQAMRSEVAAAQEVHTATERGGATPSESDTGSPRSHNLFRRCSFQSAHLSALEKYTQELERLIDGKLPPGESLPRMDLEEQTALFNELSERHHTLEVQKQDADHEIRRLQRLLAEREEKDAASESASTKHVALHHRASASDSTADDSAAAGAATIKTAASRIDVGNFWFGEVAAKKEGKTTGGFMLSKDGCKEAKRQRKVNEGPDGRSQDGGRVANAALQLRPPKQRSTLHSPISGSPRGSNRSPRVSEMVAAAVNIFKNRVAEGTAEERETKRAERQEKRERRTFEKTRSLSHAALPSQAILEDAEAEASSHKLQRSSLNPAHMERVRPSLNGSSSVGVQLFHKSQSPNPKNRGEASGKTPSEVIGKFHTVQSVQLQRHYPGQSAGGVLDTLSDGGSPREARAAAQRKETRINRDKERKKQAPESVHSDGAHHKDPHRKSDRSHPSSHTASHDLKSHHGTSHDAKSHHGHHAAESHAHHHHHHGGVGVRNHEHSNDDVHSQGAPSQDHRKDRRTNLKDKGHTTLKDHAHAALKHHKKGHSHHSHANEKEKEEGESWWPLPAW